jgi:hypothetical protein
MLKGALRAAVWKSTPAPPSVTIRFVLLWMIAATIAEAARQYVAIDDAASFSLYGIDSLIAETAILAAAGLLFFSQHRAAALAQMFALILLAESAVIAAIRWPVLTAATVVVALGLLVFRRNRTAVIWKLFTLGALAELAAVAAARLPDVDWARLMPALWTTTNATILCSIVLLAWWIGAAAAILRSTLDPHRRPLLRALGLVATSAIAIAALPAFPTFVGHDFDLSSYNLWEWVSAKIQKPDHEAAPRVDRAAIDLAQPTLLEDQIRGLRPERTGTTDIYTIGIAGWSEQDVFVKELNGGLAALDNAIGMNRGTVRLVNRADTTETLPVASRTNFASAVHSIAKIMNRDEDILVIFITSHGGPSGVALYLADALSATLSPDHVAAVLDREGIRNRLLIVSACYSGVFVKRLASPDSIVLTAADENSPSFGCSNEREWTYFGDALFHENLGAGVSLEQAFDKAKTTISQWEARDDIPPSNPQGFFGSQLAEKLRSLRGTDDAQLQQALPASATP